MKKITQRRFKGMYIFLFLMMGSSFSAFSKTFTEVGSIPFTANQHGTNTFADIDGDTDLDLLILGDSGGGVYIAELYRNDGSGGFTLISGTPFTGVMKGDAVFGDVDGNTDLDVIISGESASGAITELFLNDGTGAFAVSATHSFTGIRGNSALALANVDVDGDGDLDLMLSGWDGSAKITELHTNNGSGTFTLVAGTPFPGFDSGGIDFADVDGDTDLDVLLTGKEQISTLSLTELYLNDGFGTFTKDATASTTIADVRSSDAQFADIDGDGDLDIIVVGYDDSAAAAATKLYTNVAGVFTLHATLDGYGSSPRVDFADIDNDGDVDLFISGWSYSISAADTILYLNDGLGTFTITADSFIGMRSGDIESEDIDGDGDGDNDVIISGWDDTLVPSDKRNVKLYTNDLILGIDDAVLSEIKIYPNPTSSELYFDLKENQLLNIQIMDVLGKDVKSIKSISENKIDISELATGTYLLKFNFESTSVVKRIIKN